MKIESIECFVGCDGTLFENDPCFPRCGTSIYPDGEHPMCDLKTCEIYIICAAMIATARDELVIREPSQPEELIPFCDTVVNYYLEKDEQQGIVPPCPNTGAHRWLRGSSYIPHIVPSFTEKIQHNLLMKRLDLLHFFRKTHWQISELLESLSR